MFDGTGGEPQAQTPESARDPCIRSAVAPENDVAKQDETSHLVVPSPTSSQQRQSPMGASSRFSFASQSLQQAQMKNQGGAGFASIVELLQVEGSMIEEQLQQFAQQIALTNQALLDLASKCHDLRNAQDAEREQREVADGKVMELLRLDVKRENEDLRAELERERQERLSWDQRLSSVRSSLDKEITDRENAVTALANAERQKRSEAAADAQAEVERLQQLALTTESTKRQLQNLESSLQKKCTDIESTLVEETDSRQSASTRAERRICELQAMLDQELEARERNMAQLEKRMKAAIDRVEREANSGDLAETVLPDLKIALLTHVDKEIRAASGKLSSSMEDLKLEWKSDMEQNARELRTELDHQIKKLHDSLEAEENRISASLNSLMAATTSGLNDRLTSADQRAGILDQKMSKFDLQLSAALAAVEEEGSQRANDKQETENLISSLQASLSEERRSRLQIALEQEQLNKAAELLSKDVAQQSSLHEARLEGVAANLHRALSEEREHRSIGDAANSAAVLQVENRSEVLELNVRECESTVENQVVVLKNSVDAKVDKEKLERQAANDQLAKDWSERELRLEKQLCETVQDARELCQKELSVLIEDAVDAEKSSRQDEIQKSCQRLWAALNTHTHDVIQNENTGLTGCTSRHDIDDLPIASPSSPRVVVAENFYPRSASPRVVPAHPVHGPIPLAFGKRVNVAHQTGSPPHPMGARIITHFPTPPATIVRTVHRQPENIASTPALPPVAQASTPSVPAYQASASSVPPVAVGQVRYVEGTYRGDQSTWPVTIAVEEEAPTSERSKATLQGGEGSGSLSPTVTLQGGSGSLSPLM